MKRHLFPHFLYKLCFASLLFSLFCNQKTITQNYFSSSEESEENDDKATLLYSCNQPTDTDTCFDDSKKYNTSISSMKILFVLGHFPVLSEKVIINQIIGLIKRGHIIHIYAKKSGDLPKIHEDIIKYKLLDRTFYKELPSNLNEFDIIFCQFGPQGKKFAEIKLKKKFRGKLITCFRGIDISKKILENPHMYDQLFKVADLFMPVCKFFKDRLKKLGCKSEKIIVHHSAIDCSQFMFKQRFPDLDGSIRIVSTCRLIEKKGLEYAIRAVAQAHEKHPNIQYLIIGGGPLEEELIILGNCFLIAK